MATYGHEGGHAFNEDQRDSMRPTREQLETEIERLKAENQKIRERNGELQADLTNQADAHTTMWAFYEAGGTDSDCWAALVEQRDDARKRATALGDEIERLRLLIRCEQIEPPADVTDDQTTELAVELAYAKTEIDRLRAELEKESKRYIDGTRHAAEMLEFTEDWTLIYNHLMQLVEGGD